MNFINIYQYFQKPQPIYIAKEVAVCYVLNVLLESGDSYGSALIQYIKEVHPPYQTSDTVLYYALEFLLEETIIQSYWQKLPGRGRPRRMFSIRSEKLDDAKRLAQMWHQYLGTDNRVETAEIM